MDAPNLNLAVVIGIDAYRSGIAPLSTMVSDATRLAEILQTYHGYEVILLRQEEATKSQLAALFREELPRRLRENAQLLVYFAGHAVSSDGDSGPNAALLPIDADPKDPTTFVGWSDLAGWLDALPCVHALLILDCNFAGAFILPAAAAHGGLPDVLYREDYDRLLSLPARQVIISGSVADTALEILGRAEPRQPAGRHSPFATALFDGLQGDADLVPSHQGDGVITASELVAYLREAVPIQSLQTGEEIGQYLQSTNVQGTEAATSTSVPGFWTFGRHAEGEYVFLTPGREINLPPKPQGARQPVSERKPFEPETLLVPSGPFLMGSDDFTVQLLREDLAIYAVEDVAWRAEMEALSLLDLPGA